MNKNIFFPVVLIVLIVSSNIFSQSNDKFAKSNVWEIGGSFSYMYYKYVNDGNENSSGIMIVEFAPYFGHFATNGFEIGIIPAFEYQSYGENYDLNNLTLYLAPAYNINTKSPAYPYIQGAIGYGSQWGKDISSSSGFAWHLEGGLKYRMFGNCLLKGGLNYSQKTLESSEHHGGRDGVNTICFTVGFNVFFY